MSSPDSARPLGSDPPLGSRFLFTIDGVEIGLFSSVSGLSVTVQTESVTEGGQNGYTKKLPGRMEWPNIVFSRGVVQSDALFNWVNKTSGPGFEQAGNKLTRSTGSITAVGYDGTQLRRWNISGAFAVRWKGPDFGADNDNPMTEELEIAHEGFVAVTVAS